METRECFHWKKSWSSQMPFTPATHGGAGMFSLFCCVTDPGSPTRICSSACLFFHPAFFFFFFSRPIRSLPWKGFQQEFRRHPCEQRTAPSASREWRITSNYYIKRMATREKVWAWPSQRDLSVRDQESCCNFLWARPHTKVYMTSFYSLYLWILAEFSLFYHLQELP